MLDKNTNIKTELNSLHKNHNAKLVDFAGYEMPLSYELGSIKENINTRTKATIFDVSHMGQFEIIGNQAGSFLDNLVPSNISNLKEGQLKYTMFLNQNGNIIDDIIVRKNKKSITIIVNASQRKEDYNLIESQLPSELSLDNLSNLSLIALQGPLSSKILEIYDSRIKDINFMNGFSINLDNISVFISRSGYTGEDGFEISVENKYVEELVLKLLSYDDITLAGLGARDTLRLEAGLCLYGNELSLDYTPIEANLAWVVSPKKLLRKSFNGYENISKQLKDGVSRIRVGILIKDKIVARKDVEIFCIEEKKIGYVTSGGYSPSINSSIAMGYIEFKYSSIGSIILLKVRGKLYEGKIVPLPFIKNKYVKTNNSFRSF